MGRDDNIFSSLLIGASGEVGYHNCEHDFGSYTNDAICECNPHPNGTCPSGDSKVPLRCLIGASNASKAPR